MINNELFFNIIPQKLFPKDLQDFSNVEITEELIDKLINYTKQEISIENICALCSFLAYSNIERLYDSLLEIINSYSNILISQLDKKIPELEFDRYDYRILFLEQLITNEYNKNAISKIPYYNETDVFKDKYGIKYFLYLLLVNNFYEFDMWLIKTSRIDLKLILLEFLLHFGHFLQLHDIKYSKSQNKFIKILHCLSAYPISRHLPAKHPIEKIFESFLSNNDKLYMICYYILDHFQYDEKNEELNRLLDNINNPNLLDKITNNLLDKLEPKIQSYEHILIMINRIKDVNAKKSCKIWLYNKISNLHFKDFFILNMQLTNIYHTIIIDLGGEYKDKLNKRYQKLIKSLIMPYSFFRNREWIGIFNEFVFLSVTKFQIAYLEQNISECQNILGTYNNIKRNYYIVNIEKFDDIMAQLTEKLHSNIK